MSPANKERFKLLFFVASAMAIDEYQVGISSFENSYLIIVYPALFGLVLIHMIYKIAKTYRGGLFIKTTFDTARRIALIVLSIAVLSATFFIEWNLLLFFWFCLYSGTYLLFTGIFYRNSVRLIVNEGLLHLNYKDRSQHELSTLSSFEFGGNTLRLHGEDKTIEVYRISNRKANLDKLTTFLNHFSDNPPA